jgi:hypothetical protein
MRDRQQLVDIGRLIDAGQLQPVVAKELRPGVGGK